MSAELPNLNFVLLEISNQLRQDNLDKLKFLVRDVVGKNKLEKIQTGYDLFDALKERRRLGARDTDFLVQLLRQVGREDLSERLGGLEVRAGGPGPQLSDTEAAKLDVAAEVIRENLGRNWRKLGRKLRLGEVKLESISTRHPTDLEETAMELLKEWRRSRGAEARTDELVAALRGCHLNLTADRIQEKLEQQGLSSAA